MKGFGGLGVAVLAVFCVLDPIEAKAVSAVPVKLMWDASTNTCVAGYKVCYGKVNSTVTNSLDVGNSLETAVANLTAGTNYFFQIVAYDVYGVESDPSNQIQYTPPVLTQVQVAAREDGTLQVQFRGPAGATCLVQYTDSLNPPDWRPLGSAEADYDGSVMISDPGVSPTGMRFYRAVYQ